MFSRHLASIPEFFFCFHCTYCLADVVILVSLHMYGWGGCKWPGMMRGGGGGGGGLGRHSKDNSNLCLNSFDFGLYFTNH